MTYKTKILTRETLPAIEAMLEIYYSRKLIIKVAGRYTTIEGSQIEQALKLKAETLEFVNKLIDMKVPIESLIISTGRTRAQFGPSGMYISNERLYGGNNTANLIAHFNSNKYDYPGAVDRLLKFVSTIGSNISKVSGNSIRKWLKGEIKIDEFKWLKMIVVQSLQNSIV